jgi:hypothetical protein
MLMQGAVAVPPPPLVFGVTGRAATGPLFAGNNLAVALPPANPGDLILVVAWTGATISGPGSAAGYQRVGYVNGGGGGVGFGVFVRNATGSDACLIVNPSGGWASAMSWVIEKATTNSVGVVTNYSPGGGVNVPFPAITFQPDVAATPDFLTIVAAALNIPAASITSYPAGYTNGRAAIDSINGGSMAAAEKNCQALPPSYGEAPGNMVLNAANARSTATITIANNYPSPARGIEGILPAVQLEDDVLSPATPSASIKFNNDGTIDITGNGSTIVSPSRWFDPATSDVGVQYYFRLTLISGTLPTSGSAGVWLGPMFNNYYGWPANFTWGWTRSINGTTNATWRIEIATDAAGTNIVASSPNCTTLVVRSV